MYSDVNPISYKRRAHYGIHRQRMWIGQGSKCYWCKIECVFDYEGLQPENHFTTDHIIPLSLFGTSHWRNMVGACYKCNQERNQRWRHYKFTWLVDPNTQPLVLATYSLADKLQKVLK